VLERPHTEFIHAQALPWRRIPPGGARADAEYKFLSRDPNDGACSCLIRYPAGWTREAAECLSADEEFYVLEGEIVIDDTHYTPDTYAFLPAGWPHRRMHVPRGAVLLCIYSAQPDPAPLSSDPSVIQRAQQRAVPYLDVLHMPWDRTLNDNKLAHLGISRKDLRRDPDSGERTFLSMILPHSEPPGSRGPTETHPTVEEVYMINGSLVGPHGEMFPGAYFWRPPGIPHGPFGTRWGCVMLIRFVGGLHKNVWSENDAPFDWHAPYRPVLPDEQAHLARSSWRPAGIY
jgi:quercetin dioxygenase-like cupin family protein